MKHNRRLCSLDDLEEDVVEISNVMVILKSGSFQKAGEVVFQRSPTNVYLSHCLSVCVSIPLGVD